MNVEIPEALRYFSDETDAQLSGRLDRYPYFQYELEKKQFPWLEEGNGLFLLEDYWNALEAALEKKQAERSKDVKKEVDALLALFFMALFWVNEQPAQPVYWKALEASLAVKPINFKERFDYITSRPYTYMAYRQLLELMTELKKAAAVAALRKKTR